MLTALIAVLLLYAGILIVTSVIGAFIAVVIVNRLSR